MRKITFKQSYNYLPREIKSHIKTSYIVGHAVYSVECDNVKINDLISLCNKYNVNYELS